MTDKPGRSGLMTRRSALTVTTAAAVATMSVQPQSALASPQQRKGSAGPAFDIVDAQVHIGPHDTESLVASMDAIGIRSALLYEHWGMSASGDPRHHPPGFVMPNGAWRAATTVAAAACMTHPKRFGCVVKVDRRDPNLRAVLETLSSTPYVRAVRVLPVWTADDSAAFANGALNELFSIVQELGLPVFLFNPGHAEHLRPYLKRYPRLTAIVDHIGMPFPNIPVGTRSNEQDREAHFLKVMQLADFDNVFLKWSHTHRLPAPDGDTNAHLRRAISRFGSDRILWAGDHTLIERTWLQLLNDITDDDRLTSIEKANILGNTSRTVLKLSD